MFCIWLTGLSGAGKSTLANQLKAQLNAVVLDADDVRSTVNSDLGYTEEDRDKNVIRIGQIAKLILDQGMSVIVPCTSPKDSVREEVRAMLDQCCVAFLMVHVNATLDAVTLRDPKGLYAKRELGKIRNMVGIDIPYEPPVLGDSTIEVNTVIEDFEESVTYIRNCLDRLLLENEES